MIVYRIARKKRIIELSGIGSEKTGGRWNPKGYPVLYTASTSSLAILENMVHVDLDLYPSDLYFAVIEIKDNFSHKILKDHELPPDWNKFPNPDSLKEIGKKWLKENKSSYLRYQVPLIQKKKTI